MRDCKIFSYGASGCRKIRASAAEVPLAVTPCIESFFDQATATFTHVVYDTAPGSAAIIDSVLDFDIKSGQISTQSADRLLQFLTAKALAAEWILETHVHADHLSGAQYLAHKTGARIAIGAAVTDVRRLFAPMLDPGASFDDPRSEFDQLLQDGDELRCGALRLTAMAVPGHTPADMAYHVGDAVFVGDSLFMPDIGTARCDFPGGDAQRLFRSIQRLLQLPDATRIFLCHDYPPKERSAAAVVTVAAQKANNIHVRDGVTETEFIELRTKRDATLAVPALLWPAVQVNLRAGSLPAGKNNGRRYLSLPLDPPAGYPG